MRIHEAGFARFGPAILIPMKILVIGANGKIGRLFCRIAAERGLAVRALVRDPEQRSFFDAIGVEGEFVTGMNESAIGMALPIYPMILGAARLNPTGRKGVATSHMFAPDQAREVGYFDDVVEADEVDATLEKLLGEWAKLNPGAFNANKTAMNKQLIADIDASPLPDFG